MGGKGKVSIRRAVVFHGHLGPYLILGLRAGEIALKKLRCKKYFSLEVRVWGADKKPRSCLIDGLQLSTGATYGKGNIKKVNGAIIKIMFYNYSNHRRIILKFKDNLIKKLRGVKDHRDSELLAKQLYNEKFSDLFTITHRY